MGQIQYKECDLIVRCRVVDPNVIVRGPNFRKIEVPEQSLPYIGEEGCIPDDFNDRGQIHLDNGVILHQADCWWVPINKDGSIKREPRPRKY